MMLKSVIASVVCAAAAVAAAKEKPECRPTISGTLQMWGFNNTATPELLGVNATKSGEYVGVQGEGVKEPLEVVLEDCSYSTKNGNVTLYHGYKHLATKKQKDLCVTHRADKVLRQLVLEHCTDDVHEASKKQDFSLYYGKGLKEQNATLFASTTEGMRTMIHPFVVLQQLGGQEKPDKIIVSMTTAADPDVLQIGNPKVHK